MHTVNRVARTFIVPDWSYRSIRIWVMGYGARSTVHVYDSLSVCVEQGAIKMCMILEYGYDYDILRLGLLVCIRHTYAHIWYIQVWYGNERYQYFWLAVVWNTVQYTQYSIPTLSFKSKTNECYILQTNLYIRQKLSHETSPKFLDFRLMYIQYWIHAFDCKFDVGIDYTYENSDQVQKHESLALSSLVVRVDGASISKH